MESLGENTGPYAIEVNTIKHRGVPVTTIVNSPYYDNLLSNLESAYTYDVGYVPAGYEHRPDLISNVFYGTPKNWWLLMLVNSITDPNEGFYLNQKILIPKL
jgi:hypothetical protein